MTLRIGFLVSHPIQYYAPIFRALAARCDRILGLEHGVLRVRKASAAASRIPGEEAS